MAQPLVIDLYADPVCPWCWLGKRRLEAALAARPDVEATLRVQPFLLDPSTPPEGFERAAYLEAKFEDPERLRAAQDQLTALGRDEGIAYLFAEIERYPSTVDAHRALLWAAEEGPLAQSALLERLFEAYFTEGEDISDHAVIGRAAEDAGLDADTLLERLETDDDVDMVRDAAERARAIGVTGVPCFIFQEKLVVMGAHPPEVLVEAIDRALGDEDDAEA
ncbi:DSBA oxidoreductase [Methylopila jiangsuensis]|uniref:DSBA oxidoreductase n=1 Tax=Methylopila jiangsuensis TaxID=586230 RepID=A0A9W6N2Z7_9HYPH|nr:DsbA family oxidoreductase [Methylopila jiangsuensis]MDR6286006.1 putative DsbA family dithiol-disulfide isomerase [Methylopila jiangsuensis]GLK75763.1 DSBA oxidoreductase [Methylopila jiangsuensis]